MIHLIVNADDLGINSDRDRGIIDAYQKGIVTSATLLANGSSFGSAVQLSAETGLPVGVHLNLSEGSTLSGPIAGLTAEDNRLPGKMAMRQYLMAEQVDHVGIQREFSAQIEKVLQAGLQPDHLDGHQHCHAYPAIAELVVSLAKEYGINALRSVCPAAADRAPVPDDLAEDIRIFSEIGQTAQALYRAAKIRTSCGLWGLTLLNSLDTVNLCALLEDLPEGQWELMSHPGYPHPQGRHFESPQRAVEVKALCSQEVQQIIARRGIRLATFGDLPCAS